MNTLSVLIPTFNYDCSSLIRTISGQLREGDELLVADDGSTNLTWKERNRKACEEVNTAVEKVTCRFIDVGHNTGRSAIRNRLGKEAKGEWLLFMDNDAAVKDEGFILRYRQFLSEADVICGGTEAPLTCPSPDVSLRWRYEKDFWSKHDAAVRTAQPYKSFTTFNFMIRRNVFLSILFHDDIAGYGHEDTLFGEDLKHRQKPILHIDNPLIHMGLDRNADYLQKVEHALNNLYQQRNQLTNSYPLIRISARLHRWHLASLVRALFCAVRPLLRRNLLSSHPSLRALQCYKLGYYLSLS